MQCAAKDPGSRRNGVNCNKCRAGSRKRCANSKDYEFENAEAKADFDELLAEYENIRDLENFRERFNHMFHGPKSLSYRRGARADARNGADAPARTGPDVRATSRPSRWKICKRLLGQQALQDFQNLRQVMMLLRQSGYMAQKGDHLQLSPKGVRRIGQLALRDIYQGLLKDRAGSPSAPTIVESPKSGLTRSEAVCVSAIR